MNRHRIKVFCLAVLGFLLADGPLPGQVAVIPSPEGQTVAAATEVMRQFMTFRIQSIPRDLLNEAQGVVIIPGVVKLGFILAGRFGRGVALVRTPEGPWRAPVFVTFGGGSVGFQAGAQSTDLVLVFKNRRGIETLLSGTKLTLGADAAIAAGPVGRQAATGTDLALNAEIYSYSRSRGLFAGVSLDGSVLQVDNRATMLYYAGGTVPQPAVDLTALVSSETAAASVASVARASYTVPVQYATTADKETLRRAFVDSSQRLAATLDASWRAYLALPESLQSGAATAEQVSGVVSRYDLVASDPRYRFIAQTPQFQAAYSLLRQFAAGDSSGAGWRPSTAPGPQ
jgi:lipid-binding SYLF domain-containing protein